MLRHASKTLKGCRLSRLHFRGYSSKTYAERVHPAIVASSAAVAVTVLWCSSRKTIYNDGSALSSSVSVTGEDEQNGALVGIIFGSNKSNVLSPGTPNVDTIRTPSVAQWLKNVALRDLALHESHGACVDACGNVYQWGDGFFGSPTTSTESRKPTLTLHGKVWWPS